MNLWLKGFLGKMSQFTGEDVDPILFRSNIRLLAVWHFSTSSQELLFALFEQESSLFEQRQFDFFTTHICFTSNIVQTQLRFLHCFTEIDIKSGVFCFQNMFFFRTRNKDPSDMDRIGHRIIARVVATPGFGPTGG